MQVTFDRDEFLRDRRDMLLSLDPQMMRSFAAKWGAAASKDDELLIACMHLARIDEREIPKAEREYSRHWLKQNGYTRWLK